MDNSNFNWGNFGGGPLQVPQAQAATQVTQPQRRGFFSNLGHNLASPFVYAGKSIGDTAASMTAAATGNKLAEQNANRALTNVMGSGTGNIIKRAAGNELQLGATLLSPELQGAGLGAKIGVGALQGGAFGTGAALANDQSAGNVVKSGLLGGLTGGAVGGTLGVLGNVAGKIGERGAAKAASEAEQATAASAAQDIAPYQNVAQGKDVQGLVDLTKNKLGIGTAPETVQQATGLLTGENGFINGTKNQLIAISGDVNTNGVDSAVKDAINAPANVGALGTAEVKGTAGNNLWMSLKNKLDSLTNVSGSAEGGKIATGAADANAVFDEIKNVEGQINNLKGASAGTVGGATKNVLNAYKEALYEKLGSGSGLNDTIKNYTVPPEDVAAIHKAVSDAGLPASVAEYGINALNKAQNIGDIRAAEAPLVQASQLANDASNYAKGAGFVQAANKAAGLTQDETGNIVPQPQYGTTRMFGFLGRPGMAGVASAGYLGAKGINALANKLPLETLSAGAQRAAGSLPGQVASQLAVPAAVSGLNIGQPSAAPTQENATTTPGAGSLGAAMQFNPQTGKIEPIARQGSGQQNPLGVSSQDIFQAMVQDLQKNDGKNLSKLNTLYSIAKAEEKTQNPPLSSTDMKQLNATQEAAKNLSAIQTAFQGTTGTGEGVLSRILGAEPLGVGIPGGGNVRNVNATIQASLPSIAQALGMGTSSAELKAVAKMLPSNQDTQDSAQKKLSQINDKINQFASQYFGNAQKLQQSGNQNTDLTQILAGLGAVGQ